MRFVQLLASDEPPTLGSSQNWLRSNAVTQEDTHAWLPLSPNTTRRVPSAAQKAAASRKARRTKPDRPVITATHPHIQHWHWVNPCYTDNSMSASSKFQGPSPSQNVSCQAQARGGALDKPLLMSMIGAASGVIWVLPLQTCPGALFVSYMRYHI